MPDGRLLGPGSIRIALAAIALTFFVGPKASNAQEARLGTEEYDNSCAICHGPDGKGDGPFGMFLNIKPADLTVLAKNNNGEYPFLRVFESIDGRTQTPGHGDSVMPIWGDRYEIQTDVQPGTYGSELMVRSRILELVYFIQTIQAK